MFKQLILPILSIIFFAIFYLILYGLFLQVTGLEDPGGPISIITGIFIAFFAIVTGMTISDKLN